MKRISDWDRNTYGILALVCAVILFCCVNILSAFLWKNGRVDLTENKLYSLSKGTKQTISTITEPITIKFYMSSGITNVSQERGAYAFRVLELLEQYVSEANGKVVLQVIDPQPFSRAEDEAISYGLKGIQKVNTNEYFYMGLVMMNTSARQRVIAMLDPNREQFLEYDITKYINDLTQSRRKKVGIISTLIMDGQTASSMEKSLPRWAVMKQLRDLFDVQFISRSTMDIPSELDVLLVVNPHKIPQETLYAIDQYVMAGGPLIILLDPFSENEVDMGNAQYMVRPDITQLLNNWGITFSADKFVADTKLGRPVEDSSMGIYPPYISLTNEYLNPDDSITGSLKNLNFAYAGYFSFNEVKPDIKIIPLAFTSNKIAAFESTQGLNKEYLSSLQAYPLLNEEEKNGKSNAILALRIVGKPNSAFEKAPERNFLKQRPELHISKAKEDVNIILVGDSDFLADKHWVLASNELDSNQVYPFADNADFIINAIDHLSGSGSLIELRAKGQWSRPMTLIDEIRKLSDEKFREMEKDLTGQLSYITNEIHQLTELTDSFNQNSDGMRPSDEKEILEQLHQKQQQFIEIRRQLRKISAESNREVLTLQRTVILMNLLLVPGLLLLVALFVSIRRKNMRFKAPITKE